MKVKIKVILLLATGIFISCRNEVAIDDLELVEPKLEDNRFRVVMQVVVPKDDTFALYYTFGGIAFSQDQVLWRDVPGKSGTQEVQFVFPKNIKPGQIRLDFGMNKEQEDIVLNEIKMTYNQKKFSVSGESIFRYFRPDESKCTVNPDNGRLISKATNGIKLGPSLYPMENLLGPEMAKVTNETAVITQ